MTESPTARGPGAVPGWERAAPLPSVREDVLPWWVPLALGIASILFGVAVLAWPGATLRVMAFLVGVWLLLAGVARVVSAFLSGRGLGAVVLSGIVGILLILGGVACLRNLVTRLAVLATVVALVWLFSGLSELVAGFTIQGSSRIWFILLGALSVLVGIALLVWPGLSLVSLVVTTGITALAIGAGQVVFAFRARSRSATA